MNSQQNLTELEAAVEQFVLTIANLTTRVTDQRNSLFVIRGENENLNQRLANTQQENLNLRNELDATNTQLEAQTQEIAGYKTCINDLNRDKAQCEQENAKLLEELGIVNEKVERLVPLVDQLQQQNQNLQLEKGKLDAELVKKNDEIRRMQTLAQQSADTIRMKENLMVEWRNKATQCETFNQQLNQALMQVTTELSETEQQHREVNDQLRALNLRHEEKMREWNTRYQQLQQGNSRLETELNAFKNNEMVVGVFELHKLLQDLKTRIETVSGIISVPINSERRITMQGRMRDFCTDYRRMASYLESHNVNFPRIDLAGLDRSVRLHQDLNETLKKRLDRIHAIDIETQSVWRALKTIIYQIIETQKTLFTKFQAEINGIETTPVTEELAQIESLLDEAVGLNGRMEEMMAGNIE